MRDDWSTWQLVDSAFPAGGFAHSGGLEAAWRGGFVPHEEALVAFVRATLTQLGRAQLPFVDAALGDGGRFPALDRLFDASTTNHVANDASRNQGRALLRSAVEIFDSPRLEELRERVARDALACHLPVCFGTVAAAIGLDGDTTSRLFLFGGLRAVVSSAVRLGVVGPIRAQVIQRRCFAAAEKVARRCAYLDFAVGAQTAPLLEALQAGHARLYTRLFRS